jgi:hypothetical protein
MKNSSDTIGNRTYELVDMLEITSSKGGTEKAEEYICLWEKRKSSIRAGSLNKIIIFLFKRVNPLVVGCCRMPYTVQG